MTNVKRIHKVTIKRMVDESPDTSWLGAYACVASSEFSIDRKHAVDCTVNTPPVEAVAKLQHALDYIEDQTTAAGNDPEDSETMELLNQVLNDVEECSCGDMMCHEYRYFNPSFNYVDNGGKLLPSNTTEEVRGYVRQDYERMEAHNHGWCFQGIEAEAKVSLTVDAQGNRLMQDITSGGLWGIESDVDAAYLADIEKEQLAELREQLHAIGFSQRAITASFKNIERMES